MTLKYITSGYLPSSLQSPCFTGIFGNMARLKNVLCCVLYYNVDLRSEKPEIQIAEVVGGPCASSNIGNLVVAKRCTGG